MSRVRVYQNSLNKKRLATSLYSKLNEVSNDISALLEDEVQIIYEESLQEVPRDTETLASTLEIVKYKPSKTNTTIKIGYAITKDAYNEKSKAYASSYMIRVHEDLSAHHKIGKAKFLEDPVERAKQRIAAKIKALRR